MDWYCMMFSYIKNDYAEKSCATTRAAALRQNEKSTSGTTSFRM